MLERLPEFISQHPILSLTFAVLLVALIVTEIRRQMRGFKALSPAQLTQLINREEPVLIDVSATTDYDRGHIVGARHVMPSAVDPVSKPFSDWQEKPVAVYCKSGMVSEQVCRKLASAGFSQIHWLQGGLQAWQGDQLPTTREKTR